MALLLLRRAADELDKQMKKYTKETTRILCSARVACREREREGEEVNLKKRADGDKGRVGAMDACIICCAAMKCQQVSEMTASRVDPAPLKPAHTRTQTHTHTYMRSSRTHAYIYEENIFHLPGCKAARRARVECSSVY